ncbi:hypothetical protein JCM33374_g6511 [Metschnikowia sp. JCM 33374]|nr:hypothetical protein JCM33374_g6511 [Metschnikowia sp. JCM 33374]
MVENNPGQSQVQPHAQPHAYPNVQTQAPGMDNGEVYPGKHQAFNTAWHAPKLQRNSNVRSAARAPRNDGLSSVEVFKLLSERDSCQQPAPSGFRKLFGW